MAVCKGELFRVAILADDETGEPETTAQLQHRPATQQRLVLYCEHAMLVYTINAKYKSINYDDSVPNMAQCLCNTQKLITRNNDAIMVEIIEQLAKCTPNKS